MKIKNLKENFCITGEQKVIIRSETNFIDGVDFKNWKVFVDDSTIDELVLDDSAYCILVGNHVVTIWVL